MNGKGKITRGQLSPGFNSEIDGIAAHLNDIANNNRKIKYLLSASPYGMSGNDSNVPNTESDADYQLTRYKEMGIDGIVLCLNYKLDTDNQIYVKETLEMIEYYIQKAIELKIPVRALKIHASDKLFFTGNLINKDFEDKYIATTKTIANKFNKYNIPYFVVYNEDIGYLFDANLDKQKVIGLINYIKDIGYTVGISGINVEILASTQKWIVDNTDIMMPFLYQRVSYKGKDTKLSDSVESFKQTALKYNHFRKKFNKPIIISECGTLPYWEALSNPVYFDWGTKYIKDNSGEVQKTYFYGLFNNCDFNDTIEEIWIWFPDNMIEERPFENCKKFFKHYLGGIK